MNIDAIIKRQALSMTPTEIASLPDVNFVRSTISRHEAGSIISIGYATDLDFMIKRQTDLIIAIEHDLLIAQMINAVPALPYFDNQPLFEQITGCKQPSTYKIWQNTICRFVNRGVTFNHIDSVKPIVKDSFMARWLKEEGAR